MAEQIDKRAEQRLIKSVERTIQYVNEGVDPTEALVKVASAEKHTPEEMRRIQEAYNQSRTLYHLQKSSGMDRHKTFPLCNADKAIEQVYPSKFTMTGQVKSAELAAQLAYRDTANYIDAINSTKRLDNYRSQFTKAASTNSVADSSSASKHTAPNRTKKDYAYTKMQLAKSAAEDATVRLQQQYLNIRGNIRQYIGDTPFHELEIGLHQKFGKAASSTADFLWGSLGLGSKWGHRRATPDELSRYDSILVDTTAPAFSVAENLVKSALQFQDAARNYHNLSKEYNTLADLERDHQIKSLEDYGINVKVHGHTKKAAYPNANSVSDLSGETTPNHFEKYSFFPGAPRFLQNLQQSIGGEGPLDLGARLERATYQALDDLEDPDLRDAIRQIRIQSMFNDFINNDEVISGYDPEEVAEFFNEIAQIAPGLVDRPAVMRGFLRRSLQQGHIEPFEAGQMASLSTSITEANKPENLALRDEYVENLERDSQVRDVDIDSVIGTVLEGGPREGWNKERRDKQEERDFQRELRNRDHALQRELRYGDRKFQSSQREAEQAYRERRDNVLDARYEDQIGYDRSRDSDQDAYRRDRDAVSDAYNEAMRADRAAQARAQQQLTERGLDLRQRDSDRSHDIALQKLDLDTKGMGLSERQDARQQQRHDLDMLGVGDELADRAGRARANRADPNVGHHYQEAARRMYPKVQQVTRQYP